MALDHRASSSSGPAATEAQAPAPESIDALNAELDQAIAERVRLHAARERREISVRDYLAGLRGVRDVEDRLEPQRRALGATRSRAFVLVALQDDEHGRRARTALGWPEQQLDLFGAAA